MGLARRASNQLAALLHLSTLCVMPARTDRSIPLDLFQVNNYYYYEQRGGRGEVEQLWISGKLERLNCMH
jgi:hypothetical protein